MDRIFLTKTTKEFIVFKGRKSYRIPKKPIMWMVSVLCLLLFSLLVMAFGNQQDEGLVCMAPYLRVGEECCLDNDMNRICDILEEIETIECNPPYIDKGPECCLDYNDNGVCDDDDHLIEPAIESPATVEEPEPTAEDVLEYKRQLKRFSAPVQAEYDDVVVDLREFDFEIQGLYGRNIGIVYGYTMEIVNRRNEPLNVGYKVAVTSPVGVIYSSEVQYIEEIGPLKTYKRVFQSKQPLFTFKDPVRFDVSVTSNEIEERNRLIAKTSRMIVIPGAVRPAVKGFLNANKDIGDPGLPEE